MQQNIFKRFHRKWKWRNCFFFPHKCSSCMELCVFWCKYNCTSSKNVSVPSGICEKYCILQNSVILKNVTLPRRWNYSQFLVSRISLHLIALHFSVVQCTVSVYVWVFESLWFWGNVMPPSVSIQVHLQHTAAMLQF